ncbi:MAG TPA: M48 family metallopeptidase [Rhizomicrobium sp.]|jgi:STE24 endopeptidase|nr:M48 family metallopeptidase [Rhizomicrobium sp.]
MGWRQAAVVMVVLCATFLAGFDAYAQKDLRAAPLSPVTEQALPARAAPAHAIPFDPVKATNAYLARVSGEARKRSDSYFEGGYVLILVDGLYAVAVAALLLWTGLSARMRNAAQRVTRSRFAQVPIYVAMFIVATTVLTFPLTLYEGFFREHAYGLSNQNFAQWFRDFGVGFLLQLVAAAIALTLIYAVIRASKRLWWAWGTLVAVALSACIIMIAPVFVSPLFNHYKPLPESPMKEKILSLAKANGIPVDNVYEFDASKQSKRISANVSGLFGTTRISLNDNLMNRCTPAEIEAVLGHEMGHYVLSHVVIGITWFGLVFLVAFLFLDWGFRALTDIFGGNWEVRSIDDPAGLPVLSALLAIFFVLATPVTNTITRTIEAQADIFGLNAARQPDGFATATLKLSEYRKLDPTPLEEFVFYDHPSGRTRIMNAMRWKFWHLNDPDIKAGPVSPQ